jgi:hypothetical protein
MCECSSLPASLLTLGISICDRGPLCEEGLHVFLVVVLHAVS